MQGPVWIANTERYFPVNKWAVMVPQDDLLYIGYTPVARFADKAEAEALRDKMLADNIYMLDRDGWWRRLERCDGCGMLCALNQIASRDVGTEYERHSCPMCNILAIGQGVEQ